MCILLRMTPCRFNERTAGENGDKCEKFDTSQLVYVRISLYNMTDVYSYIHKAWLTSSSLLSQARASLCFCNIAPR